jgi:hypothetical protein
VSGRTLVVTLSGRAAAPLKVTVRHAARTVARASAKTGARHVTVRLTRRLVKGTYTVRVSATENGRTSTALWVLKVR